MIKNLKVSFSMLLGVGMVGSGMERYEVVSKDM